MRNILLCVILSICIVANAQNDFEHSYTRPLHDVISDVEQRFKVNIKVEVDTVGVVLKYADSRIRPYSIEETLTNILKPLDYRWERKGKKKFVVRKFDYPRRTFDEGKKMIDYLYTLYSDSASWTERKDTLLTEIRQRLDIDRFMDMRATSPQIFKSKTRKHAGYTTQNFAIETLPGLYVCATVYRPDYKAKNRALPLIICPNGHFADGRYNDEQQIRKATLARMGAICVDYDLIGWGESQMQLGSEAHTTAYANTLQLVNGLTILDHMLAEGGIDPTRIGVNGGSGGGTQAMYLSVIDDRFTASCPTVSLAAHFDGGCPCESGRAAAFSAGGSCHPEIAACFAPKPMRIISDSGDWTANVPTVELPYLQYIYNMYGARDKVDNVHLEGERHDFGPNKRRAVYEFFAKTFNLDSSKIDESAVTIESPAEMQTFGDINKFPDGAIKTFQELIEIINQ